jgi:hypothetical protein
MKPECGRRRLNEVVSAIRDMLLDDGFYLFGNIASACGGAFDQAFLDMRRDSTEQNGFSVRRWFSRSHEIYPRFIYY